MASAAEPEGSGPPAEEEVPASSGRAIAGAQPRATSTDGSDVAPVFFGLTLKSFLARSVLVIGLLYVFGVGQASPSPAQSQKRTLVRAEVTTRGSEPTTDDYIQQG
eukprot:TRINITY_DN34827_c0_g1_i1.p2 TRINITY_DN34827_c0_g1~~TRINITY_DN34827_c0_g1_i1.p2  ORF type:complete len:118 (-),score=28.07 TRINITY_DN34827_c0_g1_i1:32-349(-)